MLWNLELVTPPALSLVTAEELKAQMRLDDIDDEDPWLETKSRDAHVKVENHSSKALLTQTWRLKLPGWPASNVIRPPRPPLQSVSSITYLDTDGASQTLASTLYDVDAVSEPGRIGLGYNDSWPSLRYQYGVLPITVNYVAGHTTRTDQRLEGPRAAIMELLALWREHREGHIQFGSVQPLNEVETAILRRHLDGGFRCYYDFGTDCAGY